MIYEKIYLREDDPNIYLETYCFNLGITPCDALLVIPGGGYQMVSDREGEPIARAFAAEHFNCFVLHYSIGADATYPRPLVDAALAMKHIRSNAQKYNIHPDRVFAVGFSAGGHLCGMLGTMWHRSEIAALAQTDMQTIRPTGVMLIYPVLTACIYRHSGTIERITNGDNSEESLLAVAIDKNVDHLSVPAFFMHTANDGVVPVENTCLTALAYSAAKIPFEAHIYPDGPHGIALATSATSGGNTNMEDTEVAKWISQAAAWSRRI